jgi:hypothetical protein
MAEYLAQHREEELAGGVEGEIGCIDPEGCD